MSGGIGGQVSVSIPTITGNFYKNGIQRGWGVHIRLFASYIITAFKEKCTLSLAKCGTSVRLVRLNCPKGAPQEHHKCRRGGPLWEFQRFYFWTFSYQRLSFINYCNKNQM